MSFFQPKRFCPKCSTSFTALLPDSSATQESWFLALFSGGGADIVGWVGLIVAAAVGYKWGIAIGCVLFVVILISALALQRHLTVYVCPNCYQKSRFAQLSCHLAQQGIQADAASPRRLT